MSNILSKDSSKVSYTQKLIVSKKFDNFAKITLRVIETGPSRIAQILDTGPVFAVLPMSNIFQNLTTETF